MHVLHPKLWPCYTLHPTSSLSLTWMKKYNIIWKDLIASLLNLLKTKNKLHFITLNYTPYYTLHPKLWISIKINFKLNIGVAIVYDSKHAFKKI